LAFIPSAPVARLTSVVVLALTSRTNVSTPLSMSSGSRFVEAELKLTRLPSADIEGWKDPPCHGPQCPHCAGPTIGFALAPAAPVARLTSVVLSVRTSKRKTSGMRSPSSGCRYGDDDANAT